MYELVKVRDTIRVPPTEFGKNLNEIILTITQELYEGLLDEDLGVIVAVTNSKKTGPGKVIAGDGAAYYESELEMIVYKPKMHEVTEARVKDTAEFGAFIGIGPVEGLVHVSQLMDEYINYDSKNNKFSAKNSTKSIGIGDTVLARVVTISLKGTTSDSKIGLTMRQPFFGKLDWIEKEIKDKKKAKTKNSTKGDKKWAKKKLVETAELY